MLIVFKFSAKLRAFFAALTFTYDPLTLTVAYFRYFTFHLYTLESPQLFLSLFYLTSMPNKSSSFRSQKTFTRVYSTHFPYHLWPQSYRSNFPHLFSDSKHTAATSVLWYNKYFCLLCRCQILSLDIVNLKEFGIGKELEMCTNYS